MEKLASWLKNYWFLLTAFFSISVAYGQATIKIQSLEDAVKQNAVVHEEVKQIRSQVERTDERTKALFESYSRQERMIELLLQNQQHALTSQKIPTQRKN